LPNEIGWNASAIDNSLDAVILGMHARTDNPELLKAQDLGLKIYSYPEYLYEQSKNKCRVVIGGSHGKTTITAMILHVLKYVKIDADYMVGAQLEGFDVMVKLSDNARFMILEGDEYLTSPIDLRPKFHLYRPNIALISGIAWDHINVFPTYKNYVSQFEQFIDLIENDGALIYCQDDNEVDRVVSASKRQIEFKPYSLPNYNISEAQTILNTKLGPISLKVFGEHNLRNLEGARLICESIGIRNELFYEAIQSFKGASNRLELVASSQHTNCYKDFAHSPSKLKATTEALKNQFANRALIACMELHTFSSLNKNFLNEYKGSLDAADFPIIYFNEHTLAHKKLPELTSSEVRKAFDNESLEVFTNQNDLIQHLKGLSLKERNILFMTSGNFSGIDLKKFSIQLLEG
jgi:UDP-N-acetylmuramate: L-alanyl-gamma-D-glutamyl-meso-diaminopimelate ligase